MDKETLNNPKKGDILIAIDKCIMFRSKHETLTIDKEYTIIKVDGNDIVIIDDEKKEHYFDKTKNNCEDWRGYFKLKQRQKHI